MSVRNEILEQQEMLRSLVRSWSADVSDLRKRVGRPGGMLLVGRGTSDNAARFAQYLLGIEHRMPSALATPSLYSGYGSEPGFPSDWAIVAISQSGASPDLAAVLGATRNRSNLKVAITNNPESPLASVADVVVPLGAGRESSVAATKTYVASLSAVLRLSDAMSDESPSEPDAIVSAVEEVLSLESDVARAAAAVADMESCAVIGRGLHMASAFEWALKMSETSSLAAVPFSSADFLHGPVAMVDATRPVLAVIDADPFARRLTEIVSSLSAERDISSVVLSFVDGVAASHVVRLPSVAPRLNPIVAAVAFQLFSLHLALARGSDPDNPRGLSKVTETL